MRRGHDRERQVRAVLERDHLVVRAAGSFGLCDLVALPLETPLCPHCELPRARARLIEVKSTITPYAHFSPEDRRALSRVARWTGSRAELAWWPKGGKLRIIEEEAWPR